MKENQEPSGRESIKNTFKKWKAKRKNDSPSPTLSLQVETKPSFPPDTFFTQSVDRIRTVLTLDEILNLKTEAEQKIYREQLIIESARKILTDPFFVHPTTGLPLKLDKDKKQHWQELYCKQRKSTDITNVNLIMLEGEIAAAAKTTVAKFFSPDYNFYGQIFVELLTVDSTEFPIEKIQKGAGNDRITLSEDFALQRHATQIAYFREQCN